MLITNDIKKVISEAPIVPIVTVSATGEPHLIVVGKVKEVKEDDILVFGIFKMEKTQQNIKETEVMQVALVSKTDGPKGYRLSGKACIEGQAVLFKAEKIEALI
ncbi:pyridoxamine 5'-phosphate oxidase family protein [Desulfitobacterium sp.]|uniref:pyridoxamine 5'-phosphate oxidase family protein n=1 Tax=Desulfitobacterium sp. TaxID=49981 RepID=UPI002C3A7AE4|nr:pyridoxamine 5'-phosphate oxidase family protein [Desulfitobacterium sp.]HVJ49715.1 pyridoxamine 5'-phosphate oxidase family protein [Desulfitobacterium sp.]